MKGMWLAPFKIRLNLANYFKAVYFVFSKKEKSFQFYMKLIWNLSVWWGAIVFMKHQMFARLNFNQAPIKIITTLT